MDLDFLLFQLKLLYSVTPHVPLRENLRAVMAPALGKLKRYSKAQVGLHVFVNPELSELHAMVVGTSDATTRALNEELARRHQPKGNLVPNADLADYRGLKWPSDRDPSEAKTRRLFKADRGESLIGLSGQLLDLLQRLSETNLAEFGSQKPKAGDKVIVMPIGTPPYVRLGYILLWAPGEDLLPHYSDPKKKEGLCARIRQAGQFMRHSSWR